MTDRLRARLDALLHWAYVALYASCVLMLTVYAVVIVALLGRHT